MYRLVFMFSLAVLVSCSGNDHPQFSGYVEGENIYLASPFYGVLNQLLVQRGQQVTKGTLLFKLDANPQLLNLAQTKQDLEQAKNVLADLKKPRREPEIKAIEAQIAQTNSQIRLAEIRLARQKTLIERKATDRDSVDAAQANLQSQQELKLQYESNLALAKLGSREDQIKAQQNLVNSLNEKLNENQWEVDQKSISAPESGLIFDTYYNQGEYVAAQQPVLSLLTPENVYIEFFVPLDYLAKLHLGQKIHFDCEGCKANNPAEISYVSPEAEFLPPLVYTQENSSKLVFRIKARIAEPLLYKPGQPVTVTL